MSSALASLSVVVALSMGHPQGFHKRLVLNVSLTRIEGLIAMDLDGGERCRLLRDGADTNRDGLLDDQEREVLRTKLVNLATRALKLSISGFPIPPQVKEVKVDLRKDHTVSESGVSVAVILQADHPAQVDPGMSLEIEDTAPDFSPIAVEVNQLQKQGSNEPRATTQLEYKTKWKVRLGALAPL